MAQGFDPWKKKDRGRFADYSAYKTIEPPKAHFSDLASILELDNTIELDSSDALAPMVDEAPDAQQEVDDYISYAEAGQAQRDNERQARNAVLAVIAAQSDPEWDALHAWVSAACNYITPVEFVSSGVGSSDPDFDYIKWASAENDRRSAAKKSSDGYDRDYMAGHSRRSDRNGSLKSSTIGRAGGLWASSCAESRRVSRQAPRGWRRG